MNWIVTKLAKYKHIIVPTKGRH